MKRYTQEEKDVALQRAAEIGVIKAAEELNISSQSLSKWRKEVKAAALAEAAQAAEEKAKQEAAEAEAQAQAAGPEEFLSEEYQTMAQRLEQAEKEQEALRAQNADLQRRLDRAIKMIRSMIE